MTNNNEDANDYPDDWRMDLELPADPVDPWGAGLDPWRQTGRDHQLRAYAAVASWLRREPASATALMDYVSTLSDARTNEVDDSAAAALSAVIGVLDAITHGLQSIGVGARIAQILDVGPTPIPLDDRDNHDDTHD